VNTPAAVTVPLVELHVTLWEGEFVPVTSAVQVDELPIVNVVGLHVTETLVTVGNGGGTAVTVTVALPDLVASCTLTAVTIADPTTLGVNTPAVVTDPFADVHVTACAGEFVPLTFAEQVVEAPSAIVVGAHVTATPVTVGAEDGGCCGVEGLEPATPPHPTKSITKMISPNVLNIEVSFQVGGRTKRNYLVT
jgi:hypothetical protein